MNVYPSPSRCNRDTSPGRGFFLISFAAVFLCLISLVSSFAKEETRETRRKEKKEERLPQSRLAFWRNGSFASSAQTVSRLLGETAGTSPVRKSDSTGFAGLFRWWAVVVRSLPNVKLAMSPCDKNRLLTSYRGYGRNRLWAAVVRSLLDVSGF